jgi:hypothetical protein
MAYTITHEPDFVRAQLVGRETVEETKKFLRAVARYSARHPAVLIQVRASKGIFQVERYGLIEHFKEIARSPSHRVALLADTADLRVSHEYIEFLAQQRGLNVRSFRSEAEALQWLRERQPQPEPVARPARAEFEERRRLQDRRQQRDRRQGERRGQGRRGRS